MNEAGIDTVSSAKAVPPFTEGPWYFEAGDDGFYIGNAGSNACFVPGYTDHPHNIANAQLIAAAPEMLDDHKENARILGYLVTELQGRIEAGKLGAIQSCLDRSKRSVAKAEGRS